MEQEIIVAGDAVSSELLATQVLVNHTIINTCAYVSECDVN